MVLTHHHHQQQQHLSHLDRVGIVFQKYRVRFQKPQEWENPRGNPNRIKYQSYTGVWVNYTVKKPKKSWFWWMGLELLYTSYYRDVGANRQLSATCGGAGVECAESIKGKERQLRHYPGRRAMRNECRR